MKKPLLFLGLGAVGVVGWLLLAASDAGAATEPAPDEPDEPDEPEELPDLGPVPPGELPTDDQLDLPDVVVPAPPDRITVDPVETLPPTPIEDGDLLDTIKRELPTVPPPFVPQPRPRVKAPPVDLPRVELPQLPEAPPVVAPPAADVAPITAAMVEELLLAEQTPRWKFRSRLVEDWQRARGLKADGEFGPKSARLLAQETGLLPVVRYWAKAQGANPQRAVEQFRADVRSLAADAEEPRRTHLLAAAEREQGQGFGTPPQPITTIIEWQG